MGNWKDYKIGDIILNIADGGTPSRHDLSNFGNEVNWVVISDIQDEIFDTKEKLSQKGFSRCSSVLWKPGSIILSTGATIGEVGITRVFTATKQGISGIEVKEELILSEYLKYWFQLNKSQIKQLAQGSTIKEIRPSTLVKIPITIPESKEEQSTIASILTTIDHAIEKTEQLIAKYERIKTGLMQDLLTRGIDEQGNIRIEETHEFKDSPLGRIPREWEVGNVKDYLSYISYGFTNPMPTTEIGPVMISAANIFEGKIQYDTCRLTSQKDFDTILTPKSKPKIGDVLMTKDGTLGRLAIADRENICITQSVAIMRTRPEKIDTQFFKILLESPKYQKVIFDESGGSTIKHVYITKLAKMQIALPKTVDEQIRILEKLSSIFDSTDELYNQLGNFKNIKTGLMQDLLTGKVRVANLLNNKELFTSPVTS